MLSAIQYRNAKRLFNDCVKDMSHCPCDGEQALFDNLCSSFVQRLNVAKLPPEPHGKMLELLHEPSLDNYLSAIECLLGEIKNYENKKEN